MASEDQGLVRNERQALLDAVHGSDGYAGDADLGGDLEGDLARPGA